MSREEAPKRRALEVFDALATDSLVSREVFLTACLSAGLRVTQVETMWAGLELKGTKLKKPELLSGATKFHEEIGQVHRHLLTVALARPLVGEDGRAPPNGALRGEATSYPIAFQWHGMQVTAPKAAGELPAHAVGRVLATARHGAPTRELGETMPSPPDSSGLLSAQERIQLREDVEHSWHALDAFRPSAAVGDGASLVPPPVRPGFTDNEVRIEGRIEWDGLIESHIKEAGVRAHRASNPCSPRVPRCTRGDVTVCSSRVACGCCRHSSRRRTSRSRTMSRRCRSRKRSGRYTRHVASHRDTARWPSPSMASSSRSPSRCSTACRAPRA